MFKKLQNQLRPYLTQDVLKPIGQVLGSQVLLQIIGFGIGILLVREMPKTDYALYTILMSIQGMLAVISGSGIMTGFRKVGGKIWNDDIKMASLIKTGSVIRSYITVFAFSIAGGYGAFLLNEQDISIPRIVFFLFCILLIVIPSIYTVFIDEAFLLRKDVASVQLKNLIREAIRLFCVIILYLFFEELIIVNTILCITIIGTWAGYFFILKRSKSMRGINAEVDLQYKKTLVHYIKILWHNELYFAFNSQISIFIIATFGTIGNVAELGALSKFAFIFTAFTVLISQIFAPRFARSSGMLELKKQYVQLFVILMFCSIGIFLMVHFFPRLFLEILGESYLELADELKLFMIFSIVNLFVGASNYLNQARGWVKYRPIWEIPLNIGALIFGVFTFDLTTLSGVIYISLVIALVNLALSIANSLAGFKELKRRSVT